MYPWIIAIKQENLTYRTIDENQIA